MAKATSIFRKATSDDHILYCPLNIMKKTEGSLRTCQPRMHIDGSAVDIPSSLLLLCIYSQASPVYYKRKKCSWHAPDITRTPWLRYKGNSNLEDKWAYSRAIPDINIVITGPMMTCRLSCVREREKLILPWGHLGINFGNCKLDLILGHYPSCQRLLTDPSKQRTRGLPLSSICLI